MIRAECVKCGESFMQSGIYDPAAADMYCSTCEPPALSQIDGHVHTMPDSGQTHYETRECWCTPILNEKDLLTGVEHWVHNDTRKEALQ